MAGLAGLVSPLRRTHVADVSPGSGLPWWALPISDTMQAIGSSPDGLSASEAARRLRSAHAMQPHRQRSDVRALLRQFTNPITLILIAATILSAILGDVVEATIILVIVLLSGSLGYYQEHTASRAVADLLATVETTVTVRREARNIDIPAADVVSGDIVVLETGDTVPGDCLLLDTLDLLVNEASLTGESYPVEKVPGPVRAEAPVSQRTNSVFMGTYVVRGGGPVLVVATGAQTVFGSIAAELEQALPATQFERGMAAFGRLLLWVMLILVAAILVVNIAFARPLLESVLFALALAVGITPQLLPAIVTASLSYSARKMAKAKVIVKRLSAIEDFGGMNVLCTDKTGTLTEGTVRLDRVLNASGEPDATVLEAAYLNACYHTGYDNPIDDAILSSSDVSTATTRRLDEAPYDFERKRLSVLVDIGGTPTMLTKGAVDSVLAVCTAVRCGDGHNVHISEREAELRSRFAELSRSGLRVLGVARRDNIDRQTLDEADEAGMTFLGFACFSDPPKAGVGEVLRDLASAGISLRLVTGDNRFAARHVAEAVGMDAGRILTGDDLRVLPPDALVERARDVTVFAEIEPSQKDQLVRALRQGGNDVGFLGDGINDAPALRAADVGISVDTAVNVARDAASVVLLQKDLVVLTEGVRLGRRTFSNTRKYVFITTSASFGNVTSMAATTLFLPFLPLLPFQVLLLNFLTDLPAMTIAADAVDPEEIEQPGGWDIGFVRHFMLVFGLLSSVFDLLTFGALRFVFTAGPEVFRAGWFLESVGTELTVMLVLRTRRPFFRSKPGRGLTASTIALAAFTLALLLGPLGPTLGFASLSLPLLAAIGAILAGYVIATEATKRWFYTHAGPPHPGRLQGMTRLLPLRVIRRRH